MYVVPQFPLTDTPRQFINLAYAYLDAAEALTNSIVDGTWPGSFYRGQVTLLLAFHATELFLKGCIRSVAPHQAGNIHSLTDLCLRLEEVFPSVTFEPIFGMEPAPADTQIMKAALKADKEKHQEFRYPLSSSGIPWSENRSFEPVAFLASLRRARAEFDRVF